MARHHFGNSYRRRVRRNRRDRRRGDNDGCDLSDACELDCCDFNLLTFSALFSVVVGALRASAVDPHTDLPPSRAGRLAARLVRSYQLTVSANRTAPVCPLTPSCSRYSLIALSRHGALRGGWLTVRRLRRCGRVDAGPDPVPAR